MNLKTANVLLLLGLLGGRPVRAASADSFDTNRVKEIVITLAPADWNVLRYEHRESDFFPEPGKAATTNAYTWFPATAIVDGQSFTNAQVRKKGYIGSNDTKKPALKLQLIRPKEGKGDSAAPELTLNNNQQDPAFIRQDLAYEVFRRAGVPAPRCGFARVTVNGKPLGLFTQVEAIKKPFLARNFGRSEGSLYEGGRSDLRSGWFENFEIKHDNEAKPRADLEAATRAFEGAEPVMPVLEQYLDLDEFFRFWAIESLLNDGDGYASNLNNFYVYHNPADNKLVFIPWGADTVMYSGGRGGPKSVIGVGMLAYRLYTSPEGRERYRKTLRHILENAWKEDLLLAEVNRLEALLAPTLAGTEKAQFRNNVEEVRHFIQTRRGEITPELDGAAPELKSKPLPLAKRRNVGRLEGSFSASWGRVDPSEPTGAGKATLAGTLFGERLEFSKVTSQAGDFGGGPQDNRPTIVITAKGADQHHGVLLYFTVDPESYAQTSMLPVDNTHVFGGILAMNENGQTTKMIGMLRGTLTLSRGSTNATGMAEGTLGVDVFSKLPGF